MSQLGFKQILTRWSERDNVGSWIVQHKTLKNDLFINSIVQTNQAAILI